MTAGTVTVVLSGDLDAGNECALRDHLAWLVAGQPRRIVFDMAQVGFAGCASARLIAGTGQLLPAGTRPVIVRARPIVRRVFEVTGLGARCRFTDGAR